MNIFEKSIPKDILDRDKIDELILHWYRLSIGDEIDQANPFFRFVAAWVAFNAFYSSRMHKESGDWEKIKAFARVSEVADQHGKLLKTHVEYRNAVEVLRKKNVRDLRNGRDRKIQDIDDFGQVASCLYQVRCNLFHGGKSPTNVRDRDLVDAAYLIISHFLRIYLIDQSGLTEDGLEK